MKKEDYPERSELEVMLRKQTVDRQQYFQISRFMRGKVSLSRSNDGGQFKGVKGRLSDAIEDPRNKSSSVLADEIDKEELSKIFYLLIEKMKFPVSSRVPEAAKLMLQGYSGNDLAEKMGVTKQRASQYKEKVMKKFQEMREDLETRDLMKELLNFYLVKG